MPPGIGYPNPGLPRIPNMRIQPPQVSPMFGRPERRPSGFNEFLSRPGIQQALLHTGLGLLAQSDTPGSSLAGNLGRALPVGLEMGRIAEEEEKARKQRQAQQAAYRNALEDAPPQMRAALRMLGPEQGMAVLAQQMLAPPPAPVTVGANQRLVDPSTNEVLLDVAPENEEAPERPAALRTAMELIGLDPQADIPAARRNDVRDMMMTMERSGASQTTVNLPGGADEVVTGTLAEGFDNARQAQRTIGRIDRALEIADTDAFESIAGRYSSFKEQIAAVGRELGMNGGEALALADEYQALVGALAVEELQKFGAGSGLSDRDLQEAKGLVGANRSMEPRALRAILHVVRSSQQATIDDHRDFIRRARDAGTDARLLDLWDVGDVERLDAAYGIVRGN